MKNKKLFLRITTFIIVLFTVILIGRINSYATQKTPSIYIKTNYTIKDDKLVDNKILAIFCNRIYDKFGKVNESLYSRYSEKYTNTAISLYIDDSDEPYKKYEIPTELFLSIKNCAYKTHACASYRDLSKIWCKNSYEFDLNGVEIKESFKIVFSWETSGYYGNYPYSSITEFTGYSLDGEIIVTNIGGRYVTPDQ